MMSRGAALWLRMIATLAGTAMLLAAIEIIAILSLMGTVLHGGAAEALRAVARDVGIIVLGSMTAFVVLAAWLLGRQLLTPLSSVDAALGRVSGTTDGETELLPEGGDLIGRLAPAVNRLERRLAAERQRVLAEVAERERASAELRVAREEAARSERLASVGRLAAGVAHEVGNPMTAVIAYLSMARDTVAAGGDAREYIDRIEREATRIDRILRDLLSLARPAQELRAVDLSAAAAQAIGLLRDQPAFAGATAELRFPPGLPAASADEHYVVQVLVNLLTNARKASATRIEITGSERGGEVWVEVADDGRGLPKGQRERLFEPFFTTAEVGKGTGLGLALCHATMERLGGAIEARDREGGGTSMLLRFRRWHERARGEPAAAEAAPGPKARSSVA